MELLPDVLTHNYDPARGAGRNICHLPIPEAERILEEIRVASGRRLKANYLSRRLAVEKWLIAERRSKFGGTPLCRPIYFFLGNFADGKDPSRPASLVVPLTAFRPDSLTFTYPDSMTSFPVATKEHHRFYRKEYHGHVFTLAEINAVVAKYGLPEDRWKDDPSMKHDRFIEVQVWDDRPIKALFAATLADLSPG